LFRVDPNAADGAPVYLGRGLTPFADNSGAAVMLDGRLLCIWRYARPPTWRGRQEMLATIDTSASESPELLFPAQEFIDADGARYQRGQMQLTPNGRAFVFCTYPRDGNRRGGGNQLCVADRSGRIAHRAAINQSADFFMGADGRVIVCNSPSHEESQPAESFLIIDPRTGRQESLQLPGSVLAIAPDLSCAVCLSHKPAGAQVERSLSLTDLRSHETRTMVASNLMPSIRAKDFSPYWGSRLAQIGQTMSIEDLQFCTDRDCTRAAWLVRAGEPPGGSGIMLTDLQTASTRPVLNKADIPESAERGSNPSLTVLGFSRDGQSIAFESEQGVHRIDLAGGTVTLVARKSHDADYVNWQVASDHKRVIATYFRHDDAPARRRQRADLPQIIELWDQGRCTRLRESSDPSAARWIGDRYVALATSRRIVLFDSNSNESRTILDAGTLRAN
jgi:hypothetical protein